jgi:transposase
MQLHRNAKLGLRGRRELVLAIESGMSLKAAAAAFSVSPATAHRWWHRWRAADERERRSLSCLEDRSSRPRRSPRMLCARDQARICAARRRTGWGPRLIAGETGYPHATVWRTLRRAGLSRLPRPPREQARRYEWPCPGDLLHIDSKRFSRFTRPGHAVTGLRDRTSAEKRMRVGHEFVHSLVDDHSRLAYSELHRDEQAATVAAFVERALAFFEQHGIQATRLMSDNAWTYTHSIALQELLARRGIRHLLIAKGRPQTNGKVCVSGSGCRPLGRRGCPLPSV